MNTLALLALTMTLVAEKRGKQISAGLWLSVAIVLKTSPALLSLWLVSRRRWRALVWTIAGVAAWSAAAAAVWGPQIIPDYAAAVRQTMGATFDFSNLGVRAFLNRTVGEGIAQPTHLVAFAVAVAWALLRGPVFVRLTIVMTMFSPLVWYHHLVYLVIPIMAVLPSRPLVGWIAVALIQVERMTSYRFEHLTAAPTLVAAALLFIGSSRLRVP